MAEVIVAMGVFCLFMAALMASWTAVQTTAVSALTYSDRQNDQMRVLDYLKRDVRRATTVEIYNGATLVSDTTTFGTELRVTLPDYYADSREEDDPIGPKAMNAPTIVAGDVCYGTAFTVRYYILNGAAVRNEAGTSRTVGAASGAFALSFKNETSGAVRCRLAYVQPMPGSGSRTLQRQLDVLCFPRSQLQL
jgi:type II secretory pathway pseudopilin PulG